MSTSSTTSSAPSCAGCRDFRAGDRLRVHFLVIEGTRRRTQVFEGVAIKRQGQGVRETFTVRKQSFGVGVERTFPLHSPKIERIEVAARGDVRRAKLYYLRDRVGKAARVRERGYVGPEEAIEPGLLHAPPQPRGRARRRSGGDRSWRTASSRRTAALPSAGRGAESLADQPARRMRRRRGRRSPRPRPATSGEVAEADGGGRRPATSRGGADASEEAVHGEPVAVTELGVSPARRAGARRAALQGSRRDPSRRSSTSGEPERATGDGLSRRGRRRRERRSVAGEDGRRGRAASRRGGSGGRDEAARRAERARTREAEAGSLTDSRRAGVSLRRLARGNQVVEFVLIVALALGPRVRDPGLRRQALPDPERLDGADARDRPARARRPHRQRLLRAVGRRHRRLPPAGGRRPDELCGDAAREDRPGLRPADPQGQSSENYIKRVVAGPGDTIKIIDGHVILNGKLQKEPFANFAGCDRTASTATTPRRSRFRPVTTS